MATLKHGHCSEAQSAEISNKGTDTFLVMIMSCACPRGVSHERHVML